MASSITTSLRLFTTKTFLLPKPSKSLSFYKPISFAKNPLTKSLVSVASTSTSPIQPVENLPPKLQEIIGLFQSVQEPKAKYEQLLYYGKNLKPLDTRFKTRENKVQGCVSQVWVRAYLDDQKNVVFEADSDSVLTKGLAALLVQGLSYRPVEEIVKVTPDFVLLLGLQQSLSPSRNNGFLNMLNLMQKKAVEVVFEAEKAGGSVENLESKREQNPTVASKYGGVGDLESKGESSSDKQLILEEEVSSGAADETGSNSDGLGSRGKRIREILEKELRPVVLELEDISYQHAGHAGVRGSDGETHFNLKVVSQEFEGKSMVKRHRLVYNLLQEELQSGLHALSIVAKTPSEI